MMAGHTALPMVWPSCSIRAALRARTSTRESCRAPHRAPVEVRTPAAFHSRTSEYKVRPARRSATACRIRSASSRRTVTPSFSNPNGRGPPWYSPASRWACLRAFRRSRHPLGLVLRHSSDHPGRHTARGGGQVDVPGVHRVDGDAEPLHHLHQSFQLAHLAVHPVAVHGDDVGRAGLQVAQHALVPWPRLLAGVAGRADVVVHVDLADVQAEPVGQGAAVTFLLLDTEGLAGAVEADAARRSRPGDRCVSSCQKGNIGACKRTIVVSSATRLYRSARSRNGS